MTRADDRLATVERLKAHAREHYEEGGWDYLVECWTDEEIVAELQREGIVAFSTARRHFAHVLGIRDDYRASVIAEIF